MLNFRNVNIFFIAVLLLSMIVRVAAGVPVYFYFILAATYLMLLFYGCYYVSSNYFIPVICSAKTDKKIIALSFDDGPVSQNTPKILQILKDANVQAAFFCIGSRINQSKAVLEQTYKEGHLVGNHTYSHHFWFDMFSAKKMLTDMRLMDTTMYSVIGKTPKLFRPPYGVTNPNLKKAIVQGDYTPVGWSMRSMDTVINDEKKLLKKVANKLKPGAIFLFHDTSNATVAVLPAIIEQIRANGYEIIRLDKMLNLQAYA